MAAFSDNPFARMTFPTPPSRPEADPVCKFSRNAARLISRPFNRLKDRLPHRSRAFTEAPELAGDTEETYFMVPLGVQPGQEFVVQLTTGQELVVTAPDGVRPGDMLHVVVQEIDDSDADEGEGSDVAEDRSNRKAIELIDLIHIPRPFVYLRPMFVMVCAIAFCSVLLITVAVVMPFWVTGVSDQQGVVSIGLFGYSSWGRLHEWTEVLAACAQSAHSSPHQGGLEHVEAWCSNVERLATKAKFTYVCEVCTLVLQAWCALSIVVRRELVASVGTLVSLGLHAFFSRTFFRSASIALAAALGTTPSVGASSYFGLAGIVVGTANWVVILVLWLESRQDYHFLGVNLEPLKKIMPAQFRDERAANDEYEWDESDPGAGCPILWRMYGLTPSGLYDKYQNYWWGWPFGTFIYLLSLPFHFVKTFDWNGIRRTFYGPPSEEEDVRRYGVESTVVINYMLYRRSNIIMVVVFILPLLLWNAYLLCKQFEVVQTDMQDAAGFRSFEDFRQTAGENASFFRYTSDVVSHTVHTVALQSDWLGFWKLAIRTMILVVAFIFGTTAMMRWDNFKVSRYLLLYGWCAALLAPFAATLIPCRSFMNWSRADEILQQHLDEARVHYDVDEWVAACVARDGPATLATLKKYANMFCDDMAPNIPYKMPAGFRVGFLGGVELPFSVIPVVGSYLPEPGTDLRALHNSCGYVKSRLNTHTTSDVAGFLHGACLESAALLYHNPVQDKSRRGIYTAYQDALLQKSDEVPPGASMVLKFVPSASPGRKRSELVPHDIAVVSLNEGWRLSGRLFQLAGMRACMPWPSLGPGAVLVVGPLSSACPLSKIAEMARATSGVTGVVILDKTQKFVPGTLSAAAWVSSTPSSFSIPTVLLQTPIDARVVEATFNGTRGPMVKVERIDGSMSSGGALGRRQDLSPMTSSGCRCAGNGYDSVCAVRADSLPGPWCETAVGCPAVRDTCAPHGQGGVEFPLRKCLPELPCGRVHMGIDPSTHKPFASGMVTHRASHYQCGYQVHRGMLARVDWMKCVPPVGLHGVAITTSGASAIEGGPIFDMPAGTVHVVLQGLLRLSSSCTYAVRAEPLDVQVRWQLSDGPTAKLHSFENSDFITLNQNQSREPFIRILVDSEPSTPVTAITLEEVCPVFGNAAPFAQYAVPLRGEALFQDMGSPMLEEPVPATADPVAWWRRQVSSTSYGCTCKVVGSPLAACRPIATKGGVHHCETERPCKEFVDVCAPPEVDPHVRNKDCLPMFPCRRVHNIIHPRTHGFVTYDHGDDHDVCATSYSPGRFRDSATWVKCVAEPGFAVQFDRASGTKYAHGVGSSVSMAEPTLSVKIGGALLVQPNCSYRFHVWSSLGFNISSRFDVTFQISKGFAATLITVPWGGFEASSEVNGEMDIWLEVAAPAGSDIPEGATVALQQRCNDSGAAAFLGGEDGWAPVPLSDLRGSDWPSPGARLPPPDSSLVELGSSSSRRVSVARHDAQYVFPDDPALLMVAASTDPAAGSTRRNASARQGGQFDVDPASEDGPSTCVAFVGTPCGATHRCDANEACDSEGLDGRRLKGFCYCKPGHCWSYDMNGCVSLAVHVHEMTKNAPEESIAEMPLKRAM